MFATHMGEWRRNLTINPINTKLTAYEFEYATTIGLYYRFVPAWMSELRYRANIETVAVAVREVKFAGAEV
jgi:hypothetical protein